MPQLNNPFKPTQPVYSGVFAGRIDEITRIETVLLETKNKNPTNLLIIGERGIGKTSLLLLSRLLAAGSVQFNTQEGDLDFLTIFITLNKRMTIAQLARSMNTAMERELESVQKAIQYMKKAWDFIQRLDICGIQIKGDASPTSDSEIFERLTYATADTVKCITSPESARNKLGLSHPKHGLVIFIDEADNASPELDLGTLIKQLSEKLVMEDCNNVLIILSGLPEIRSILRTSHGSALRLFEELELFPLSSADVKKVINRGLEEANKKNSIPVAITEQALNNIVAYSEGYPHFVQQFGYSSYAIDVDNLIDEKDVSDASFTTGGAIDLIGDKYYKHMYFEKIKKDSYRQVLKIMSEKWDGWISKQEIRAQFKGKNSTLDNALKALHDRKIILRKSGTRGEYRLQWAGFAFWIKVFAEKMEMQIGIYSNGMEKE